MDVMTYHRLGCSYPKYPCSCGGPSVQLSDDEIRRALPIRGDTAPHLRRPMMNTTDMDAALDRIYDIASHLEQEGTGHDDRRKGRRIMNIIDQVDEEGEDDGE